MNNKIYRIYRIVQIIAYISALVLCIMFYDWKLFLILTLFGWGMNLEDMIRP